MEKRETQGQEFEERVVAIKRVAKVVKGGRRFSFAALVVVGNQNGEVGFGTGKAGEVPEAIGKASRGAKKSFRTVSLVDGRTIQFQQSGRSLLQKVTNAAGTLTITNTLTTNLIYIAFAFPHTDDVSIVSVAVTMGKNIQLGSQKVLELTVQNVRVMN